MPFEYKITRRVEFSDTDMEGIMHYSNFFRFMETAEHAFFRSFGYSVVLSRAGIDVCLPRAHAECDYLAPLHFEDEVLIHLLVERKGKRSLTYQFTFSKVGPAGPVVAAQGRLVVVCAARQASGTLRSVALPPEIATHIEQAPSELLRNAAVEQPGEPPFAPSISAS